MKKEWHIILIATLALISVSIITVLGFGVHKKHFLEKMRSDAVSNIRNLSNNETWIREQISILDAKSKQDKAKGWISDNFILTKNKEWIVYFNRCSKEDSIFYTLLAAFGGGGGAYDVFICRASDGKWYKSNYHFCIGMFTLIMDNYDNQPESLEYLKKNYKFTEEKF